MPADYNSTAQALALSPDRSSSPSPSRPPWSTTSSSRRLSNPLMNRRRASTSYAGGGKTSFVRRIWGTVNLLGEQVLKALSQLACLAFWLLSTRMSSSNGLSQRPSSGALFQEVGLWPFCWSSSLRSLLLLDTRPRAQSRVLCMGFP
ncbi:hypothetical protein LB505_009052 [Fusarium chuoi]|nr:hypothetical protein LB505_009052 [Fusarium chuoi]